MASLRRFANTRLAIIENNKGTKPQKWLASWIGMKQGSEMA
jgi:hypothetical protein